MQSKASSPDAYLAELPEDRRAMVSAIRDTINAALPEGYVECMQYGMLGWAVPHSRYPAGYHCDPRQPVPFASVASQKNAVSVYLFCIYLSPELTEWFVQEYQKTGKRLDMGKGCVRFKKSADLPLELLAEAVRRMPLDRFLETYTAQIPASAKKQGR